MRNDVAPIIKHAATRVARRTLQANASDGQSEGLTHECKLQEHLYAGVSKAGMRITITTMAIYICRCLLGSLHNSNYKTHHPIPEEEKHTLIGQRTQGNFFFKGSATSASGRYGYA
jgi:hypothetical protein